MRYIYTLWLIFIFIVYLLCFKILYLNSHQKPIEVEKKIIRGKEFTVIIENNKNCIVTKEKLNGLTRTVVIVCGER